MVVVGLEKQIAPAVFVSKKSRMTAFAGIPFAGRAVWQQRHIVRARPIHPVGAVGDADLLRVVVEPAGVKHHERIPATGQRGRFDAFGFPLQFGLQNRLVAKLGPICAAEIGIQRRGRHAQFLRLSRRIARGEIQQQPVAIGKNFRVNRASVVPIASGMENRIGFIALKVDAIVRNGVADRVLGKISVGLVK